MVAARSVLCPVVVGRERELDVLGRRLDEAAAGNGGVVVIVGEAGAGKSRLARESLARAEHAGLAVLSGRSVPEGASVPYRPLTEAFLGAFRGGGRPATPDLAGFEGHLGRLVPAWRVTTEVGIDESPVVVNEAAVRLLGVLARRSGAVLLIEDLHWADVETLAMVEYFADALVDQRVLCIATARLDGAVDTLARLRRHPSAIVAELSALTSDEIERLVVAALGEASAPAAVVEFVVSHSDGNPFLAEELLAGLVSSQVLVHDGGWATTGALTPSVPTDVSRSIRTRMATFEPSTRRVVQAAAVLGRRFDWNLIPAVADVDGRTTVDALREAVDAQLVEVDGQDFRFRHVLTREAVLADLLPPERRELARRAWPAVENAHPDLPGPWCELAAELAEQAGDHVVASERLVESSRRALRAGALATAEATIGRARALAADSSAGLDADECFVQIASQSGKPLDAIAVGRPLADRMDTDEVDAERRVGLLIVLARSAIAAGDLETAADFTDRARLLVENAGPGALIADVEAVAAHVALGTDDLTTAEQVARAAVEHATTGGRPAVACEALEVLGRVIRTRSPEQAIAAFERAAGIAEANDLAEWQLRARQEIALERWIDGDTTGLWETRDLAARHGAMVTVAVMDLSLADIALAAFDRERCLERAQSCVDASRRYGLATLPVAELWLAGAHALRDDTESMDAAVTRALERDPDDPRILGDLWGRVHATRSIVRDDREQLRIDLDRMMEYVAVAPVTTSIYPNRLLWVILHSIDDDDLGVSAQAELQGLTHLQWWDTLDAVLDLARAVTLGRQGRGHDASELVRTGLARSRQYVAALGTAHYINLLVAEAQLRDGWGEPGTVLRPAEAFFATAGFDAIARRCRIAMGRAGEKMPRRGRGSSPVPEHLRSVGITSRELDVLHLIVEGCSNREIAGRLHLSPKTVERHVSSLFDRTGIRNRADLATWVVRITD